MILRVGHLTAASYEIKQQTTVARRVGLSDDKIVAIGEHPHISFDFDDAELDLVAFTDAVVKGNTASTTAQSGCA